MKCVQENEMEKNSITICHHYSTTHGLQQEEVKVSDGEHMGQMPRLWSHRFCYLFFLVIVMFVVRVGGEGNKFMLPTTEKKRFLSN